MVKLIDAINWNLFEPTERKVISSKAIDLLAQRHGGGRYKYWKSQLQYRGFVDKINWDNVTDDDLKAIIANYAETDEDYIKRTILHATPPRKTDTTISPELTPSSEIQASSRITREIPGTQSISLPLTDASRNRYSYILPNYHAINIPRQGSWRYEKPVDDEELEEESFEEVD